MCFRKRELKNPILDNHRTGFDKYVIKVACCNCPACRKSKSQDWIVRAYFEFLNNKRNAFFITLDFDDEHLPRFLGVPCFDSEVMKVFLKRLRYYIGSFRYMYATDYGGFLHRPHYHLILLPEDKLSLSKCFEGIRLSWKQGHYSNVEEIECVNHDKLKAVSYIAGYTTKDVTFDVNQWNDIPGFDGVVPPRYRPRVQASKNFGWSAFEDGHINDQDLISGNSVSLPIGKNGKIQKFAIPRYYEMKRCYDSKWIKDEMKQELTKNQLGIEVAKNRHNRHYIHYIKKFFASRWSEFDTSSLPQMYNGKSWYNVVCDTLSFFDDFKEFVYYRPFITFLSDTSVCDNIRNEVLFRPNWHFYSIVCQFFDLQYKQFDLVRFSMENERLLQSARKRALKKLQTRPYLRRYLASKHFDFSILTKS